MSARKHAATGLNVVLTLLFLPGRIVEEALHALGAVAFAKRISVELEPGAGSVYTEVEFRERTPQWAIKFAYALPELVASAAGIAVISFWLLGGDVWFPSTTVDWILMCLFGAQWLAIALPSSEDTDQTAEGSS